MEVGDYVRTKSYGIKKINGFSSTLEEDFIVCDYDKNAIILINKKDIIKSSLNIIDLIEVGDYVNGERIIEISESRKVLFYWDYDRLRSIENGSIKSIVTKEQFESMEYKINESEE